MPYEPEYLHKWTPNISAFDSFENYGGPDFSREWYMAPVMNQRDAGPLQRSNFDVVWKDLEQYATDIIDEDGDEVSSVEIHRFGHWAWGWHELILIHHTNDAALKAADEWAAALEEYPVADEMHYSELEWDEMCETWNYLSMADRIDMLQDNGGSIFAARRDEIPDECYEALREWVQG